MTALPARLLAVTALLVLATAAPAQMTPDQQAAMVLDTARRAYNDKNYPVAVARFREFMQKFGGHKDRPGAQYGLALALLEGPDKDYQTALNELTPLANNANFTQQPYALYYTGLARRGLGVRALALAVAKPQEASQHQNQARQHFEEAAKQFAAAVAAFTKRVPKPDPAQAPPLDLEWASRARCDQAEMLLRVGKAKEAREAVAPLLDDALLKKGRYHHLGLYYHGFAGFLLKDYPAAARSLGQLAPYTDPVFGTHARYLRARIHHLNDERTEAQREYQAVLADHDKARHAAADELRHPERHKNDPAEKARLEALVKAAPPDHVARATFFLGVLKYEEGQYGEALARFAAFPRDFPITSLAGEAQLRQGFCQVQLKMWTDAQKTLQPLADKELRLADQCFLWLGKAQVGAANPGNKPAYEQALRTALETFRKAADRANQMTAADPGARLRRGECLLELADTQQLLGQYREAATTYNQVLNEKLLPNREEELYQGLAVAWQMAGDHAQSDAACTRFSTSFPKSALLPDVLFRHAENAYFQMLAAEKANKAAERNRLADEMAKRYREVAEKFPDYANAGLARFGLAVAHYRKGEMDKALERLEAIPLAERTGELAIVPYLIADCLLRQAPAAAAQGKQRLLRACDLLENFVGGAPNHPQAADALIKLGHCRQRLSAQEADSKERTKQLAAARTAYEQLLQRFPKSESQPLAVFERGKCLAAANDANGAINDLRRFTQDPLKATPIAPVAILSLATLLRGQHKTGEAAQALAQCRQQHEARLAQQPAMQMLVPLLQYQHGLALREEGKGVEARVLLDGVARSHPERPEAADAALRSGQSLKEDALKKIAEGKHKLAANLPPPQMVAAKALVDAGWADLHKAVQSFGSAAELLRQRQPTSDTRARLLYEAAWTCRLLAEPEIEAARTKVLQDLVAKRHLELIKLRQPNPAAPNAPVPLATLVPPEVSPAAIPIQPSEQQARNFYQMLILAFPDLALNVNARFELAEMHSARDEHDAAIKLLKEALDKKPPTELADKICVRLGACLLAKGDAKEALKVLKPVADNAKSAVHAHALFRVGECHALLNEPAEAVKSFAIFRDQGPYQNLSGLSDRALLRLGNSLGEQGQWDASRQALEQLATRFPHSPWVAEARYAAGWAYQKQGQYDQAVSAYQQVIDRVATELAARAQINIGLCRMAQKRYSDASTALLIVPYTYDYPHLTALALIEAARAFSENKQEGQALRLLERIVHDHPDTEQAEAARRRLAELKKI